MPCRTTGDQRYLPPHRSYLERLSNAQTSLNHIHKEFVQANILITTDCRAFLGVITSLCKNPPCARRLVQSFIQERRSSSVGETASTGSRKQVACDLNDVTWSQRSVLLLAHSSSSLAFETTQFCPHYAKTTPKGHIS